ncbi:hypothetical protein AB4156_42705, partial [Cupriavidus sp. 2MCAB6]|uniref:hypothetical protein n=1 Tax=Cupriavidus sp. 2MCAB6 TaxID=3232981 RepID=UPI003F929395
MTNGAPFPSAAAESRKSINEQVVSVLASDPALSQKTVMFAQISHHMTPEAITFGLMQKNHPVPAIVSEYYSDDIAKHISALNKSHYVIELSPEYSSPLAFLPHWKVAAEMHEMLGRK